MIACPFSAERLHEMMWRDGWKLAHIATLACALTEEAVSVETVQGWYDAAGISVERGPTPAVKVRRVGRPRCKLETRRCAYRECGKTITRPSYQHEGDVSFCCTGHQRLETAARASEAREVRRLAAKAPGMAVAVGFLPERKVCAGCGAEKQIGAFSVDLSKPGGRARLCLECNKAKCKAFYERNRDRMKRKARERKSKEKAYVPPGSTTRPIQ